MKKPLVRKQPVSRSRVALVAAIATVLVGGSFALASGDIIAKSSSLMAAVITSITGNPTVLLGKSGLSPTAAIKPNSSQLLAVYDISAKNVTHWATFDALNVQAVVTPGSVSPIELKAMKLSYQYCIPVGKTYGYGWKGGNCALVSVSPASMTRSGNVYTMKFYLNAPVFPESSYGRLSFVGTLGQYQYTKDATKTGSGDAKVQIKVTSGTISGDQCTAKPVYGYVDSKWVLISNKTTCFAKSGTLNIQAGSSNVLTITRPYGYGYNPSQVTAPVLITSFAGTPASVPAGTASTLAWNVTSLGSGSCSIYYSKDGAAKLLKDNVGAKGTLAVTPTVTTTYNLYCNRSAPVSGASKYATVTVVPKTVGAVVTGVYEGTHAASTASHPEGEVTVNVTGEATGNRDLVLTAYEPVHWIISNPNKIAINKIILLGYYAQRVTGQPTTTTVESHSYTTDGIYQYAYQASGTSYTNLMNWLKDRYGSNAMYQAGGYTGKTLNIYIGQKG